jgi:hypothetical protein
VNLKTGQGPLAAAVVRLRDEHKIPIFIDAKALADAGTPADPEVEFSATEVSLRDALKDALDDYELAAAVNHGLLWITTREKAAVTLQVRVYPVGDLVSPQTASAARSGRHANRNVQSGHFDSLVDAITSSVWRTSWASVGGPGSITMSPTGQMLVVSQTADAHQQISQLLADVRKSIAEQEQGKKFAAPAELDPSAMETRVYRVNPLLTDKTKETPPAPIAEEQMAQLVQTFVAPESWSAGAAAGKSKPDKAPTIRAAPGVLVVRQTRAVHDEIAAFLAKLGVVTGGGMGFF